MDNNPAVAPSIEPNSKPSLFKRIMAGMFDAFIMFFFNTALFSLMLMTPLGDTINGYRNKAVLIQQDLSVKAGYGEEEVVDSDYSGERLLHYNEQEDYYYVVKTKDFAENDPAKEETRNAWIKLVNESQEYNDAIFYLSLHSFVGTAVACGFVTELIFMFIIPIIKNNGRTLGMMVYGIRMINPKYQGKPKWYQYLGRFLFMFAIESVIPYFLLSQFTVIVVPIILLIVMLIDKKKNRTLHDFVSGIMVIEKTTFVDNTRKEEDDNKDVIDALYENNQNKDNTEINE